MGKNKSKKARRKRWYKARLKEYERVRFKEIFRAHFVKKGILKK